MCVIVTAIYHIYLAIIFCIYRHSLHCLRGMVWDGVGGCRCEATKPQHVFEFGEAGELCGSTAYGGGLINMEQNQVYKKTECMSLWEEWS